MKWQPITTVPKDGHAVLLCRASDADGHPITGDARGVFVQVASWDGEEWIVYCHQVVDPRLHFTPTHWRNVPKFPRGPRPEAANKEIP